MFRSFFPDPKLFFLSAVGWTVVAFIIWFGVGDALKEMMNLGETWAPPIVEGERPPFFDAEKLWTYQFILMTSAIYCIAWGFIGRNRWYWWAAM